MSDTAQTSDSARDTGSWLPVPDEAELPSDLRDLFAKARRSDHGGQLTDRVSAADKLRIR